MYINIRNADVLISHKFISHDIVDRLGRDNIQKVLDTDVDFIEAEIGLSGFDDINWFFGNRVFIYDTQDEVANTHLYDKDGDDLYIIKRIVLDDGRILVVYD